MFTADKVDAARCEAIGLVNRVVPDDKLQDEAFALAKSMAEGPTIALRYMKDNLDEALLFDFATARDHEAERLIRTTMTADHREAVQAFIEKRKAVFHGEIERLPGAKLLMVRRRACAVSNHEARGPSFETPRKCAAPRMRIKPPPAARSVPPPAASWRRVFPARATSMCFSNRTSFQSSGLWVKAKPDLRASADHGLVGAQGVAEQAAGAERGGAAFQIAEQRRTDALALPAVVDRQAELETFGVGVERVAGFADDGLKAVDRHGRDHAEAVVLADMNEMLKHGFRQLAHGAEEAVVAGAGRERPEVALQCLGIARLDKTHRQRLAAAQPQDILSAAGGR